MKKSDLMDFAAFIFRSGEESYKRKNNIEKFTEDVDKTLKESRYKTASESFSDIYDTAYYLMLRNILKSFEEKEEAKRELEEFKEQHKYDYDEEEEEE